MAAKKRTCKRPTQEPPHAYELDIIREFEKEGPPETAKDQYAV